MSKCKNCGRLKKEHPVWLGENTCKIFIPNHSQEQREPKELLGETEGVTPSSLGRTSGSDIIKNDVVSLMRIAKKLDKENKGIAMKKRKETRIEVIENGERKFNKWNCVIEESIQDDGRTLKLFVSDRK